VTGQTSALLIAIGFALSCAAIYNMRPRAQAQMGILVRVALCFVPAVCVMVLSR
jgi:predicted cobalt transporter CbtA